MNISNYNYKNQIIKDNINFNIYSMNLIQSIDYFENMLYLEESESLIDIKNIYGLYDNTDFTYENIEKNDLLLNLSSIFFTNKIIYSIINKDIIKFLDIRDNEYYSIYKVDIKIVDAPIVYFYCNINNPFIIIQSTSYTDFFFSIFLNDRIILETSCSKAGNSEQINSVLNNLDIKKIYILKELKKKYLFFGFNHNIGHHLWNEISGLYYFLENKEFHNKIDGIIIGKYDYFNIEEYLRNNYSFNINKYNEHTELDCIPLFLNHFYIHKDVKYLVDKSFNKDKIYFENIIDDVIEICISIRTNRRILIDQDIFYSNFIENIIKKYSKYKIKVYFTGVFSTHLNKIDNNNIELINGNIIFNNIIENLKKNNILNEKIEIINLIGNSFYNIQNILKNVILMIATIGTSIPNLFNWIYNKKLIVIGPKECYTWETIQYNVLQNYNCMYAPIKVISESNIEKDLFNIDINLFTDFFISELDKLI